MPPSSTRQEQSSWRDATTAAGQLALVQYKPFQTAEVRLLEALSEAQHLSEAVATALALARSAHQLTSYGKTNVAADDGRYTRQAQPQNKARASSPRRGRPSLLCSDDSAENDSSKRSFDNSSSDDDVGRSRSGRGRAGADGGDGPALAAHAIQLALASLGGIPSHVAGAAEGRCSAAAFVLSVAMASAAEGRLPPQLLRIVSPYRATLEQLRLLGKGGFGNVVAVRSRLDNRVMALKAVAFRSGLPPWAPLEQLERQHAKLLREVQALAGLDGSPHMIRYYNAWIEPDWEKLGQQLQRSSVARESEKAEASMQSVLQALPKGAPHAATGPRLRQPPAVVKAAALPVDSAVIDGLVGGATSAPSVARLPQHALPGLAHAKSEASGSCRIRELTGSRSNSRSGSTGEGSHGGADSGSSSGEGRLSPGICHGGPQYSLPQAITPRRLSPDEPVVDLPISPDWTSAAASAVLGGVTALSPQPIVSLPASSFEATRRRSLDTVFDALWAARRRSSASGDDNAAVDAGVTSLAVPLQPVVSLVSTSEDESRLPRDWAMPVPRAAARWGQPPPLHLRSSGPLITSLSTSPEGPGGLTPTHESLLSSSVESIRVPPGARVALSPTSAIGNPARNELGLQTRAEPDSWTSNREGAPMPSTGRDTSESSTGTHSSSTAPSCTETANNTRTLADGTADTHGGAEEFSWTFDRGDEGAADVVREIRAPHGGSSGSSVGEEDYGTGGNGGRAGGLERRSRKGRRGKGARRRGLGAGGSGGSMRGSSFGSEVIFHLDGVTSISERPTRSANAGSGRDSDSSSRTGSTGGSRSTGSESGSENKSERGSESGSVSESRSRSDSDSDSNIWSESESRDSTSGGGSSDNDSEDELQPPGRRVPSSGRGRSRPAVAMVPPSQVPLLAPRHQRRWPRTQGVMHSPTEDPSTGADKRRGRRQQQARRQRRPSGQRHFAFLGDGGKTGSDGVAKNGRLSRGRARRGGPPPAGAAVAPRDLPALFGISKWPYKLYISMEVVMGPTLTRWLQLRAERLSGRGVEHPPEPANLERSIFRQIVMGLSYIHAAGIIHRDLKPANIFLVPVVAASVLGATDPSPYASGDDLPPEPTGRGIPTEPTDASHASFRVAASSPGDSSEAEWYLVKIGDFGLAVGHEANEVPSAILRTASSGSSSVSSASSLSPSPSRPSPHGPFAFDNALATAAIGQHGPNHRTPSVPLLPDLAAGILSRETGAATAAAVRPRRFSAAATKAGAHLPRLGSSSTSAHTSGVGTASYSAPEQLQGRSGGVSCYGPEVDIYPLGLILMELFCVHGTAMERANAMRDARQGRLPPAFQRTYPSEARLAAACLRARPELRPSASRILGLLDIMWGPQIGKGVASSRADADAEKRCRGGAGQAVATGPALVGNPRAAGPSKGKAAGTLANHTSMLRATSGPLPQRHQGLRPPLLPLLPPPLPPLPRPGVPPRHPPTVTKPGSSRSPCNDGQPAFPTVPGRFRAAVQAVLEDIGTQTDLTWVSEDQPLPRLLAVAENLAACTAPPPSPLVVHTDVRVEDRSVVSELVATAATAAAAIGDTDVPIERRCAPAAEAVDRAAILARLQSLEAEVHRLREQLEEQGEGEATP